ncbi:unnamed protein product [Triticum turgidum subsp. durum]|uniref:DUF569 domain-containing protein n=1 Tax=Triticum turgidum subsp. durum TaxID=4567 RepID=A0A9R0VHG1_TRITD|nr:unnamed protein product [Triticum turgidum subsp. durum]
MELFERAKTVRLRSHQNKYMYADEDESHVLQDRNAASPNARWTVELVPNAPGVIRLRSRYGRYLTASNEPILMGVTGRKVIQTLPHRLDSSVEWVPVGEGRHARLQTRYGNFLRANGGLPPLRNSVTHDVPHHRHAGWVVWCIEIVQVLVHPPRCSDPITTAYSPPLPYKPHSRSPSPSPAPLPTGALRPPAPPHHRTSTPVVAQPPPPPPGSLAPPVGFSRLESADSFSVPVHKVEGRHIHYHIADDSGYVREGDEGRSFLFNGTSLGELLERLQEDTGLKDVIICSRNPITSKLMPLRLQLPPNNNAMHVVLVHESSKVSRSFS